MFAVQSTPEERLAQAHAVYDRLVRPIHEPGDVGKFVVIDLQSNDFEVGEDLIVITRQLRDRHADAQIVGLRVGGGPVDRFKSVRVRDYR